MIPPHTSPNLTIDVQTPVSYESLETKVGAAQKKIQSSHYLTLDNLKENREWSVIYKENLTLARRGNAVASYNVGFCYFYGKGISPNTEKARDWFHLGSLEGDSECYLAAKQLQSLVSTSPEDSPLSSSPEVSEGRKEPLLQKSTKSTCCCTIL